jgi:hypothetical protein
MDTLLNQTFTDFEILLVDDGSADRSPEIEEQYCRLDSRVKLIKKEHTNAGDARNLGLNVAKGKYITFLDSDDFYEPDLLELKYRKIEEDGADICGCDADLYDNATGRYESVDYLLNHHYIPDQVPYNRNDSPNYIFQIIATGPWMYLYKRSFIMRHGLHYQSQIRANDVYFSNMATALADRITIVDKVLIHHRIGLTTNLQSGLEQTPAIYMDTELALRDGLKKNGVFDSCKGSFCRYSLSHVQRVLDQEWGEAAQKTVRERILDGILTELGILQFCADETARQLKHPECTSMQDGKVIVEFLQKLEETVPGIAGVVPLISDGNKMLQNRQRILQGDYVLLSDRTLFPFEFVPRGCRILLYGLGKTGKSFLQQIVLTKWCTIEGVGDRNPDADSFGYERYSLQGMATDRSADFIVVTIVDDKIAEQVMKELTDLGCNRSRIIRLGKKDRI